ATAAPAHVGYWRFTGQPVQVVLPAFVLHFLQGPSEPAICTFGCGQDGCGHDGVGHVASAQLTTGLCTWIPHAFDVDGGLPATRSPENGVIVPPVSSRSADVALPKTVRSPVRTSAPFDARTPTSFIA